ncbi:MAG: hypothetical protein ACREGJ_02545 [Candidatus Saccharimonadales bacterium]
MIKKNKSTRAFIYRVLALAVVIAPITFAGYVLLNPLLRGTGQEMITAYLSVNSSVNAAHLVLGIITGFLLPIGAIGFAVLAYQRKPWLATIGGLLGFVGWMPWLALIAQEALTTEMAGLGGGQQYAVLWDRFNASGLMSFYLIFYALVHLVAMVILAWAMGRARVVPGWAAWAIGLTSPITILTFPLNGIFPQFGWVGFGLVNVLFILGSLPAALRLWRLADNDTWLLAADSKESA